ncbi:hypothetical protein ACQVP2_34930 [Methylobacterium aquaticum]|uniref:hypothetical protein n=1 Tax=Methylobacterium aquaticum TaxID=270351 RepID=UPI003D167D19
MLQIGSGRLFSRETRRINNLKGVLYTNLKMAGRDTIDTAIGRLVRTDLLRPSTSIIYEYDEHIEATLDGRDVLVSHGIDSFLNDMASVISFGFDAICTTDSDLTYKLISGQRSPAVDRDPRSILRRTFDTTILAHERDIEDFAIFTKKLINLERKNFLGAMRAIRTYVTGIHRISDDLELAYTLIVASMESLAQEFDGHRASWSDYEERKRNAIDQALCEASEGTAQKVREALLQIEHTSLARRFRDFTISHTTKEFFREEAANIKFPVGRGELQQALQEAYRLRSRYVHNLSELPKILKLFNSDTEVVKDQHIVMLNIAGLCRLARHVIRQFINKQPEIASEVYDYRLERSNIVQVVMSPEFWIGNKSGLNPKAGNSYLEGFLEQFSSAAIEKLPGKNITDLTNVLIEVEKLLPAISADQRRPYIALYLLFNYIAPKKYMSKNFDLIWNKYQTEVDGPSIESLILHLITNSRVDWELSIHNKIHDDYMRRRFKKNGIRISRSLETGLTLSLAERYRSSGEIEKTKYLVSLSVENNPGISQLLAFENQLNLDEAIKWRDILFPDNSHYFEDYSI